jgi:endonuclease V-like protein UPF0215 family
VLGGLGPGHHLLDRRGQRRAGGVGHQQRVPVAGGVDQQRRVDRAVVDLLTGRRLVGDRLGVQLVLGQGVEPAHHLVADLRRGHHRDGRPVRVRMVQRPHVGDDEAELQQQRADDQHRRARGHRVPKLSCEAALTACAAQSTRHN